MTTDELIKLAEFCGKKHHLAPRGTVCVRDVHGYGIPWEPHLDANQRDELVEATIKRNCQFWLYSYTQRQGGEMRHNASFQVGDDIYSTKGSNRPEIGEAVCSAALQAIEYMEANNGTAR